MKDNEKKQKREKSYYYKHRKEINKRHRDRERKRRKDPKVKAYTKAYYQQRKGLFKERRDQLKKEVLMHYSNNKMECALCGYNNLGALCISRYKYKSRDKGKRTGTQNYLYLKTHNFPAGYRVLCCNCATEHRRCGETYLSKVGGNVYYQSIKVSLKEKRDQLKKEVLMHYSNNKMECALCGYNNLGALCIDHICHDGNEERKKRASGTPFYLWLKKHKFPGGKRYRVLCCNCNQLDHINYLKHQQKE